MIKKILLAVRISVDAAVFLFGMVITFVILLDALDSNILYLFSIAAVSNIKFALSELHSATLPAIAISILTVGGSLLKVFIDQAISNRLVPASSNDSLLVVLLCFFALALFLILVVQITMLKNLVSQTAAVDYEYLFLTKMCLGGTLFASTAIYLALGARDVVISDLRDSISTQAV